MLTHPDVAAISFVGSTTVAQYVYETAAKHGKRVQMPAGAKNHLIVAPDADLDQAAAAIQASAFGCAGERCMAGSVAVPVGDIAQPLVDRLVKIGRNMKTGPTDTGEAVDMGPPHHTRPPASACAGYLDIAKGEGATVALDGRQISAAKTDGFFVGPTGSSTASPSPCARPGGNLRPGPFRPPRA